MTEETSRRDPTPRPFDSAFPSALAAGELGVVTALAGVGKTACLVQIALAELLQGRAALHVALDMTVSQVRQWYDRLFQEAGRRRRAELVDHDASPSSQVTRRSISPSWRPSATSSAIAWTVM